MQNTKSSRPGTWGKLVKQHPAFLGRSGPDPDPETFESFVVQNGFDNFSIEEHRLADYQIFNPNSPRSESVATNVVNSKTLKLLRGRGVEVRVGPTPSQDKTWSLSANLISFHSPYLKKAYLWKENNQINLPDHDPAVFGLFVEWMHYGSYDCSAFPKHPSINAKCWILGDYLLCTGFKVYALSCLFKEHVDAAFRISISVEDVRYVCSSTTSDSTLKRFYLDFVSDHFGDPYRLRGDMAGWETFLQDQPDVRSTLLRKLRYGPPPSDLMSRAYLTIWKRGILHQSRR
ncbi:hypothetical protein FVEN_g4380 [Fusarium venenatum]|uniref:BTB domain-containing protein n=1 Tax=Fusarium venenatum TaxID=56646 RepID=A0A2L2T5Z8_9HYPO|nr:uncharacterized protein FVRRES_02736 [Fusarium venenatum]KAG8357717.1 hypothetical protein FVEN_g4380 [Fusarium venenatum]CEI66224.1 unnamed protein product [Fusarium venenatum]